MPLHLLGKKSWNVYNQDNIDRVRRDEAAAKAREEEEERRMQEVDAERRIQLLRGQQVDPPLPASTGDAGIQGGSTVGTGKKRRKLVGEDDTQRDIRLAKLDAEMTVPQNSRSQAVARKPSDAPLMGKDGHINLFPQEGPRFQVQKNPEAEAEAAKKRREYEDQYTMRFSNAAGVKQGTKKPWYSSSQPEAEETAEAVGKDVWGNDDEGRKDRERRRMENEDPLLAIRKGVSELKEIESDRRKWKEEREKELRGIERESLRRKRRDSFELENFSLDPQPRTNAAGSPDRRSAKPASRRYHRSRSRSRNHEKSHSHRSHRRETRSDRSRGHRKVSPPAPKGGDMAQLRRERDEREKKERLKTAALLAKVREDDKPAWVKGAGRYSTQFADQ
ncbi:hypothetical protein FGG08_005521 [Glutinoglossum americanum]|uniref:CBF1-interacting co-repressor CIR N-terminal domain-containing protein n=1 Tax=Glutinoglossum americanum TaxID=1670608 RepID=A0A9P8I2T6_9PEZI|nr:hypothetical protein FGG08_005521 [Glutinoglossum americanum]